MLPRGQGAEPHAAAHIGASATLRHLPRMGAYLRACLRICLSSCALALSPMPHAAAQTAVSASVSALSDYRYRGISLSDGKAAVQLNVNFDHASGWYGGGFATSSNVGDLNGAQLIAYGGYARRLSSGASWEAGCTRTAFTQWHAYDYSECYAGGSLERVSARVYFAPRYLGHDSRTVYGELNAFYPLQERINLIAHAGWLHTLSGQAYPGVPSDTRYDARLGVSIQLGDWNAQLVRSSTQSEPAYYPNYGHSPQAWILSAVYSF